jgi:transcriptional regulator with XRE-family HTH domain
MSLHDRIKEARKSKGITQTELGDLIGVAKTTVAGYEKSREPTAAQLGAIADILDVDVTFLLQDEIKQRHDLRATPQEMETLVKKYRS